MNESIYTLTTWIIPLLLCIILHEIAHGFVALKLGDRTALNAGRLTLNPIPHIDILGSLVVPAVLLISGSGFLFGWAKPVPVSVQNLNNPKRDMGIVAIAGPLSNLLLAIGFVIIGRIGFEMIPQNSQMFQWFFLNIQNGVMLSIALSIFNLLPILPLDGGRVLASILPYPHNIRYQMTEKYGFFVLLGVLFVLPHFGIDIAGWFVNMLYPVFIGIVKLFI